MVSITSWSFSGYNIGAKRIFVSKCSYSSHCTLLD